MKMQSQNLFTQISKTTSGNVTTQVAETFAKGFNNNQAKTFRTVDLWNIHRQRRTTVIR
ncbi:MAG: hypothetical protein ABI402_03030 [Ferruginibacter sp.]